MDIYQLILKSCIGKLNPAEQEVLDAWLADEGHRRLYRRVAATLRSRDAIAFLAEVDTEQALARAKGRRRHMSWPRMRVATVAGVAAAVLVAVLWWAVPGTMPPAAQSELAHATLTLPGGEVLNLNDSTLDYRSDGGQVKKSGGRVEVSSGAVPSATPNRLDVPCGEQCHLVLPDGTQVWVNALSSLTFPSSFEGKAERVVQLTGEAYFDVAPDKAHPFIVSSEGQRVTATGTAFGVYAYLGENLRTVLREGGVRVQANGGQAVDLSPGEQLLIRTDGAMVVSRVDVDAYCSWMQGVYSFDGVNLHDVFRTLSRWYDIRRVDFDINVPVERCFSGRLRKSDGLETIMVVIERGSGCDIDFHDGVVSVRLAGN